MFAVLALIFVTLVAIFAALVEMLDVFVEMLQELVENKLFTSTKSYMLSGGPGICII